ncbi:MAG: NTP transferase domain-containing protein [Pseudomonadota bacterium]
MTVIGVILAGGRSRRMNGPDKAEIRIGGRRLIDHVSDRLRRQVDEILISGAKSYGLGRKVIPDAEDVVSGPAGGIISVALWLARRRPEISGFLAVPVDGPFLPVDFASKMSGDTAAVAADEYGIHPTFAWWPVGGLAVAQEANSPNDKLSLKALAEALGARSVCWEGADHFVNLNTPDDVAAWEPVLLAAL